jgi:hypothetical protein
VPHLGRQIVSTQRDAKQEPHFRHDPIAVTDTRTSLDEVQLETSHLVGRLRIGRAFEPSGKLLTAINVAALRLSLRAAMSSIIRWRGGLTVLVLPVESSILSEVCEHLDSRAGAPHRAIAILRLVIGPSAHARSGLERSDFVFWPDADDFCRAIRD